MANKSVSSTDSWHDLKQYTAARIAIGRAGGSVTTEEWLDFKLAHAQARDAVHCQFESENLKQQLQSLSQPILVVDTQIQDRSHYLQRPDLGRCLNTASQALIAESAKLQTDLVIIVSDGLSATAVHAHAANLLKILLPMLAATAWSMAPLIIARYGRVALEDEIGALIRAKMALILIGERPGLSSPDSLGAYLVYNPKTGNTDAQRNCISNIRPAGLDYENAAETIVYLLNQARKRRLSGVELKDERCFIETNSVSDRLQHE